MPTNTKINLLKSDFQFAHFFLFLTYEGKKELPELNTKQKQKLN
jgi:hypothetical protein